MTEIKNIKIIELLSMIHMDGLILQNCGGKAQKWVEGINDLFTKEGILLGGDEFKEVYTFEKEGHTILLFNMENVKLHFGKLMMWQIRTSELLGSKFLWDFLEDGFATTTKQQHISEGEMDFSETLKLMQQCETTNKEMVPDNNFDLSP